MPYFLFRIDPKQTPAAPEYLGCFDVFREAKLRARALRAELPSDSGCTVKMIFAGGREEAEGLLKQKREPTILREWEK